MARDGTLLAGRYRVERHIGSGAMGTVYLARDEVLDRDVAVKSVHAEPHSDQGRRILREAKLGAGLRHPHLVTVYDVVTLDDSLLLVMEHVDGRTLADAVRRGPLEPGDAVRILRGVAAALDHAHGKGIVHRDVKPANVLLGSAGAVKLADLGIATGEDVTRITRTGGMLGTVAYMAPEQFDPGPVTAAVDVYALAAVAFETLAGKTPYPGATAFEVFGRLREGAELPDIRAVRPELPAAVSDVLQRGMARDPAARPATAGALVGELEPALAPAPQEPAEDTETMPVPAHVPEPRRARAEARPAPAPRPVEPARRRSGRSALIPLAIAALAGVVVAVVLLGSGGSGGSDDEEQPARADAPRTTTAPATGATTAPTTTPAPAGGGPATPVDAVRAFYELAADGDLDGSWRLAGPRLRAEFGNSRDTFKGDLGSLRAITFRRLEQTEISGDTAVVALATVAEHTDRTDTCDGTVQTVRDAKGRWKVEPLGVRCVSG